jgi:aminoglycoside 6'-N-acetyltransferase I
MEHLVIRRAEMEDVPVVAEMCHCLWPSGSASEHAAELTELLAEERCGGFPGATLLAVEPAGEIVGFIQVGLRSHADGCDPSRPVGYIEGWYVAPEHRRKKIGTELVGAAEKWAREQGCLEMASDAWMHALTSQHAHEAVGFEVVDRCVHYRKRL